MTTENLANHNYPLGFRVSGISCGIKSSGQPDLALIYSEADCRAMGMFTTNRFAAAPVIISREHLRAGPTRAIMINSGNANACTGEKGLENAKKMAGLTARFLRISPEQVLICSTGVIGVQLDIRKIEKGIKRAVEKLSPTAWPEAAKAIMTTDTKPKLISRSLNVGQTRINLTGIAKGAGMIYPQLATMLAVIATDANISLRALRPAFQKAVNVSFNSITVDGDTSTNDSTIILCNGLAGNPVINFKDKSYISFQQALREICHYLAKEIIKDGEGATKLIEINVQGARNNKEAKQVAVAVANSNLVKTAIFGGDPNWGRIICATGYSGATIEPQQVSLKVNGVQLFANSSPQPVDKETLRSLLKGREVVIDLDLGQGQGQWRVWTCDLTYDYIKINAAYPA